MAVSYTTSDLKMIGLFCKRALHKRRYSAKETYNLIDLTDRSHPIHKRAVSYPASDVFNDTREIFK
jgi:hypothetical protein